MQLTIFDVIDENTTQLDPQTLIERIRIALQGVSNRNLRVYTRIQVKIALKRIGGK